MVPKAASFSSDLPKASRMDCEFSEFSYAYALTEALKARGLCEREPPEFLSTLREGKPGGGWDVRIGAVFLQFKRPSAAIGSRARPCGALARPFYRIYLRQRENWLQHRLLLELERRTASNLVRYTAPRFWRQIEFESAYEFNQVIERSVFVPPSAGTVPKDAEPHCFAYGSADTDPTYFTSEPVLLPDPVGGAAFLRDLERLKAEREAWSTSGQLMATMNQVAAEIPKFAEAVEEEFPSRAILEEKTERRISGEPRLFARTDAEVSPSEALLRIQAVAAVSFNAEVLFVTDAPRGKESA
jgi:hypothetical protein